MLKDTKEYATIKIVGIGNGGRDTIQRISQRDALGVELIVVDSEIKHFECSNKITTVELKNLNSLEESGLISGIIEGTDLLILTTGMGGYTGTNVISIIARIARKIKIPLTMAFVTEPYIFEGETRAVAAKDGIFELAKYTDTLIVLQCENFCGDVKNFKDYPSFFHTISETIGNAIQGLYRPLTREGRVGIEFSDYRTIFTEQGFANLGIGKSSHGLSAAEMALNNQLCKDMSPRNYWQNIFLNVTGGTELSLLNIVEIQMFIQNCYDDNCNFVMGAPVSELLTDEVEVILIVTGYKKN